jgi:hypothetical protein
MKITICGSIAFIDEMEKIMNNLQSLGHEVAMPPLKFVDGNGKQWDAKDYYKFKKTQPFNDLEFLNSHHQRIRDHFDKVEWAEAILVTNYDKNNIANYIGPNTLMEMGVAFHLGKTIYLLNPIPDTAWKEEVLGLRPIIINGNLNEIK